MEEQSSIHATNSHPQLLSLITKETKRIESQIPNSTDKPIYNYAYIR